MLVLSRKPGERIMIGDDIVITVVRFNGGIVRLGIEAPREFPVIREELVKSLHGEAATTEKSESSQDRDAHRNNTPGNNKTQNKL